MDINVQAKILKAIEEKRVKRLGSGKEIPVDVRVISAMNEDPETCVAHGRLRKDLFYRIAVVQIEVPLSENGAMIYWRSPVITSGFITKKWASI